MQNSFSDMSTDKWKIKWITGIFWSKYVKIASDEVDGLNKIRILNIGHYGLKGAMFLVRPVFCML